MLDKIRTGTAPQVEGERVRARAREGGGRESGRERAGKSEGDREGKSTRARERDQAKRSQG